MKGGREDVDTPFWSWGTGLLGTFWVNNVDQNDRGKAYVPEHFPRETYFWMGFRRSEAFRTKATSIPIQILHETIFFYVPCGHPSHPTFAEKYRNILKYSWPKLRNKWSKWRDFLTPLKKSKLKTAFFSKTVDFDRYQGFKPPCKRTTQRLNTPLWFHHLRYHRAYSPRSCVRWVQS